MACTNPTCVAHREWNEQLEKQLRDLRAKLAQLERQEAQDGPKAAST